MTPEGKVKKELVGGLSKLSETPYYFFPATGGYGRSGVPDIVGCIRGKFFAIEVKVAGKVPTALQARELELIRSAEGLAFVCAGVEDIPKILNALEGAAAEIYLED